MILRSVLPVIFRKRPCLVTLLLNLSCCLHSPRHSKPVYMESQFDSRQNPPVWLERRDGVCLLFSVRLLINIHPTSENQAFGIRQTLCMRKSGVKSPRFSYLISHCFETECGNFETKLGKGSFLYKEPQGQGRSKGISFFLFLLVPVRSPPKTVVPETGFALEPF